MKTWFKVPEYLPKDCLPDYITTGKWYSSGFSEGLYKSLALDGYVIELREFPDGFNPNEVDQAIFSQHLKDIPAECPKPDNVHSPSHYNTGGSIECIDYIKDFLTEEEYIGYLRGNIAKYLHRWRYKNGLEDLEKAKVYLGWLIDAVGEPE